MDFKDPAIYISAAALLAAIGEGVYFKREIDTLTKIVNGLAEENKKRNERDKEIYELIKKYEHNMKIHSQTIDDLNTKVRTLNTHLSNVQKEQKKKLAKEIPVSKGRNKSKQILESDSESDSDDEEDEDKLAKQEAKTLANKYG